MISIMTEKEMWSIGRKAAKEVADKYLNVQINFTGIPVKGKFSTLAELFIASKEARIERLYPLGVLLYADETLKPIRLQQELEQ
jgi:hypothetical protein